MALAARLSDGLSNDCILVVEAGPAQPDNQGINVPGKKGSTLGGPLDWNFTTVPQTNLLDRVIPADRGKVLGGSSALNLMTWDRGSIPDYDAWQALGNPGWNWKNFIAAMLKVENFQNTKEDETEYGGKGVGHGGPIQTLINRIIPAQQQGFIPALQSLGIPHNLNSLDGNPIGVMYQPSNIRASNYTRSYASEYLLLAGSNLHVMVNSTVSKITTENSGKSVVATGVMINGTQIKAKKEIILSAGAFSSPQLLELSGIGQPAVLSAAGIATVLNLTGVGENLQDHIRIQNSYKLKDNYTSFDELRTNATYAAQQLALWEQDKVSEYDYTGSGYMYASWKQALGGNDSYITSLAKQSAEPGNVVDQRKLQYYTDSSLGNQVPEVEVIFSDGYTGVKGPPSVGSPNYDSHFFTLISVIMHPFSRGSVHVNSTNPAGKPVIDPNYLSKSYDVEAITQATKFSRKIAETPALRYTWQEEYEPGMAVQTDAQWEEFARNTTLSIYHPLGTCAMLPKSDGGVVDPNLLVYGTSNLRIVDSSVIPVQPSAHLQTMVYGIAELAAVRIAKQYS